MAQPLDIALVPSALVTTGGSGAAFDAGALRRALVLSVDVTAFVAPSGAPSVLLTLQTQATPSSPWRDVDTILVQAAGSYGLCAGGLDRYLRVSWALTGMTSTTFAVSGTSHVTYCDPKDITLYVVPEASIEEISQSDRAASCIAATDESDGYVGGAYALPLVAWGNDLRMHNAQLAAAYIFRKRGVDPEGPDKVVFDAMDDAIKWLDRLLNGRLKPPGIVDSTPQYFEGGSVVETNPSRGWSGRGRCR